MAPGRYLYAVCSCLVGNSL